MAKSNKKEEKKADYTTMTETVEKLIQSEWVPWRAELQKYWPSIDKMQDAWEFYKSEKEKSPSKVSLNTPFAIVESMVAKSNAIKLKIGAEAKGINGLDEVEEYVGATVEGVVKDRDISNIHGSFRKRGEMHKRDYFIKGTAFSEDQYCYKTRVINGKKTIIADAPYTDILSYKSVVFNPAYYADNSPVYWIEKNTTWEALKANELDEKTGKGMYVNLGALKANCDKSGKLIDSKDEKVIVDGKKRSRKVEPIQLLIRWEGCKMTIVANQNVIIRQAVDPLKLGSHNLHISMNYKVEGRPYAYGEIDAIYKIARAQDTLVNQGITAINQYLDPAMTYDPNDLSVNVDQIMDILEHGGIAPAKKDSISAINRVLPPQQAFQTIESLQQAEERTARYTGVASQSTDMTKGTASTLQEVNKQAAPDFQTKLDDLKETYYGPICDNYLKMVANLMGADDVRYSKMMGKKPMWVKATKNLLMGKLNVEELLRCGVIQQEDFDKFITDEATGTQYPELAKESLYDVDWLITVTLDNQAEMEKAEKTKKKTEWFMQSMQMGLPMDAKKFMLDNGQELDIEDPEQYMKDDQQVQQEQQQAQQAQQGQMQQEQDAQMQQEQAKHQMGLEAKQMEIQAKQGMQQQQTQAQSQQSQQQAQTQAQMQQEQMKAQMAMAQMKSQPMKK